MTARLVIKDASIITMTGEGEAAQAVAVEDDRIVAVGSNSDIEPLCDSGTEILSLSGKTVVPGFVDSHVHFMQTGLGSLGPNLYGVTSVSELYEIVSTAVTQAVSGQPLLIHGCTMAGLDGIVSLTELDRIAPRNPLMINDIGAHACIVNTPAWNAINLAPDTPGIEQTDSGEPAGILIGKANTSARYHYYNNMIDDNTRIAALKRATELALEKGITTVHALDGGSPDGRGWLPERDVEILLREQDNLDVRTVIYLQSTIEQRALEWRLPRIGGCIWVDGSYGEYTAALMEPYTDRPDCCGSLYFTDEELNDFVSRAHRAGLQISMHAIGDAAIEQLLRAYEHALNNDPRDDHRHRIEHFSLPTADQIERVAKLGIALGMQPNFAAMPAKTEQEDAGGLTSVLGMERYDRRHPYRRIVDSDILVAGGSDSEPKPMGPLFGMQCIAGHPDEMRRLTTYEALMLYTVNGAKIAFEENVKGGIEAGKLADMVVLSDNPLAADPRKLDSIKVEKTLVGGKIVYNACSA